MSVTELLLHPVRLRIVQAVFDGQPFTTLQLRERLPDVSRATMYRQVEILLEGGLLEIESEDRVHGAVERRYRLLPTRTLIDRDTAAAMSLDDHRRGFAAAVASLLAEFNVYLDQEGADPTSDSVSYRQFPLWLSDAEKTAFLEDVLTAIRPRMENGPSPERRRHLLSTILFPTETGSDPRPG